MKLWVGLGNPEPGMARNRHNIGFMAIDRIAHQHGFGPWRQRFRGLAFEPVDHSDRRSVRWPSPANRGAARLTAVPGKIICPTRTLSAPRRALVAISSPIAGRVGG